MATRSTSRDGTPGKPQPVSPSFRRARALYEEAVALGDPLAAKGLDELLAAIEKVTQTLGRAAWAWGVARGNRSARASPARSKHQFAIRRVWN